MPYRPIFAEQVTSYIGVDLADNPRADVHMESYGTVPLQTSSADVVLSTQVLEHVNDPSIYLGECHRILKPDGLLILSTHGYWIYHPDPQDLWRWTNEGLRRVISGAGFRIESYRGLMGLAPTALQLLQDGVTSKVPRFMHAGFFFCMQALIRGADALDSDVSRQAEACVFLVVARKITESY